MDDLSMYCGRPACRALFNSPEAPGRPAVYCSTECRREAQKERRRVVSRIEHAESVLRMLRADLARFPGVVTVGDEPVTAIDCNLCDTLVRPAEAPRG